MPLADRLFSDDLVCIHPVSKPSVPQLLTRLVSR